MPEGAPHSDRPLMIRALLTDRFELRYRIDKREENVYELSAVRDGGPLGSQLQAVKSECAAQRLAGEPMGPGCRLQADAGNVDVSGFPISVLAMYWPHSSMRW